MVFKPKIPNNIMTKITHFLFLTITLLALIPKTQCEDSDEFLAAKRELQAMGGHCCFSCTKNSDCCPGLYCGMVIEGNRRCIPYSGFTWNVCTCPEVNEGCTEFTCHGHVINGSYQCP